MGWDIAYLNWRGKPYKTEPHCAGSVYAIAGTDVTDMTITYNYAPAFHKVFPENGLKWLKDKRGTETIPILKKAVEVLGTTVSGSYWDYSPGNAGYLLSILLRWAEHHPKGRFKII